MRGHSTTVSPALPCVLALIGIAACTWFSFQLGQSLGSAGFLYLVFVVLAAVYGGFWQATLVSIVAVGCLDYFFDEPRFSFTVSSLSDLVELGAFELTALVISQLSNRANVLALERARILEKQAHAEAARQAEQLRTAVLDALAHQFKTPLTVIRTATSGLPAAGRLSPLQTELVSLIDQEARKLNDLSSRLVSAPALDSNEFAPQPEPVLLSRLTKAAVAELEEQAERDRFHIDVPAGEAPVFADRELILTALAQLTDNALKYSLRESRIDVGFVVKESAVMLTLRTRGLVVSAADRERIFERFYRARGAQECSSGTGLGLSIVKTIAEDHHGQVWAQGEEDYGTVFSLSLPKFSGVPSEVGL